MTDDQSTIRRKGLAARTALSVDARRNASEITSENVFRSSWFHRANYLACYLSVGAEVSTWSIIARAWSMKKRVFVPVLERNRHMQFREIRPETDLVENSFGILEPSSGEIASARMLDIVIAPVVAYDRNRHRVGMGGGYFDRTFSFMRHRENWLHPKLVGLAFSCQEATEIAPNPWDIRLFCCVTESGTI